MKGGLKELRNEFAQLFLSGRSMGAGVGSGVRCSADQSVCRGG